MNSFVADCRWRHHYEGRDAGHRVCDLRHDGPLRRTLHRRAHGAGTRRESFHGAYNPRITRGGGWSGHFEESSWAKILWCHCQMPEPTPGFGWPPRFDAKRVGLLAGTAEARISSGLQHRPSYGTVQVSQRPRDSRQFHHCLESLKTEWPGWLPNCSLSFLHGSTIQFYWHRNHKELYALVCREWTQTKMALYPWKSSWTPAER